MVFTIQSSAQVSTPERLNENTPGWMIYSPTEEYIAAGSSVLIDTELTITVPDNYNKLGLKLYGKIEQRIGNVTAGIITYAGIYEAGTYTNIKVRVQNLKSSEFHLFAGDPLGYFILCPFIDKNVLLIEE